MSTPRTKRIITEGRGRLCLVRAGRAGYTGNRQPRAGSKRITPLKARLWQGGSSVPARRGVWLCQFLTARVPRKRINLGRAYVSQHQWIIVGCKENDAPKSPVRRKSFRLRILSGLFLWTATRKMVGTTSGRLMKYGKYTYFESFDQHCQPVSFGPCSAHFCPAISNNINWKSLADTAEM